MKYSQTDVSVIIPAYNEELAIADVVRGLKEHVPDMKTIVVDASLNQAESKASEARAKVMKAKI